MKRRIKIPKVTYQALLTITDDGSDGVGGCGYLTRRQLKDMLTKDAGDWSGVKVRVNAMQELPPREAVK